MSQTNTSPEMGDELVLPVGVGLVVDWEDEPSEEVEPEPPEQEGA